MKLLYPALIIILSTLIIYQYFENKNIKQSTSMVIENLEKDIARIKDNYEEKIARLKYAHESKLSQAQKTQAPPADLSALVQNVRAKGKSMRQETINRAREELNLSPSAFESFTSILKEYEQQKKEVMRMSMAEQKPFFDSKYLNMLQGHKNETVQQLESILTSEQIETLLYDKSFQLLGLSPEEK